MMSRVSVFSNPFLLGFDGFERLLEQISKTSHEGYPPYNIEQFSGENGAAKLRITLAVAGFGHDDLEVTVEENQLMISGKQSDDKNETYLHHGIAARHFTRSFVLAQGMEVVSASLENGLLTISLEQPEPKRIVKKIEIRV